MNLLIIGGKSAQKLSEVIKKTFDDIYVSTYEDTNIFMQEAMLRELEVHRLILLQDGVDNISDENVYEFVDFLSSYYPATRVITISKDQDTTVFLGDLITSPFSVHFYTATMTSKMVLDIVAMDVEKLKNKYKNITYKKEMESLTNVIDEATLYPENQVEKPVKEEKRGFLSKVFGVGPKKKPNKQVSKKGGLKPIGQGQGVEELTEVEPTIFDKKESVDLDSGTDYVNDEDYINDEGYNEEVDYAMFDLEEGDIGVGFVPQPVEESTVDGDEIIGGKEFDYEEETEEETEEELTQFEDFTDEESFEGCNEEDNEGSTLEEDLDFTIPTGLRIEDIKKEIEATQIKDVSDFEIDSPKIKIDLEEIDDTPFDLGTDMATIMKDYEEETTKSRVKVVEKVIKVPVKEGMGRRNRNGVRVILVTGDRRTGVTKLSMNLAHYFAKEEKTLLVDFDRYRKGVISYIGVEEIINEPQQVLQGVKNLKTETMLNNVTYLYAKGGFYTLFSIYGEEIEDEDVLMTQKVIAAQKEFTTVVIDCPMENLYLMKNLLHTSTVLICIEDDRVGITNTIINLNSSVEDDYMPFLYENSSFVVGRGSNIEKFQQEMVYIESIFGMDESPYNWGTLEIIGTIRGTRKLAERLVI